MITFSLIMKVIGIFMMVMIILWFLGWLKLCREYRFSEGYDRELESDYQAMKILLSEMKMRWHDAIYCF